MFLKKLKEVQLNTIKEFTDEVKDLKNILNEIKKTRIIKRTINEAKRKRIQIISRRKNK